MGRGQQAEFLRQAGAGFHLLPRQSQGRRHGRGGGGPEDLCACLRGAAATPPPAALHLHEMPSILQVFRRRLWVALVERQLSRRGVSGIVGPRPMIAVEVWCIPGLLKIHPVPQMMQKELGTPLVLIVGTPRPESDCLIRTERNCGR